MSPSRHLPSFPAPRISSRKPPPTNPVSRGVGSQLAPAAVPPPDLPRKEISKKPHPGPDSHHAPQPPSSARSTLSSTSSADAAARSENPAGIRSANRRRRSPEAPEAPAEPAPAAVPKATPAAPDEATPETAHSETRAIETEPEMRTHATAASRQTQPR